MPKIDIVQKAQERLEAAWVQDRENREDAFTDLKFLAGDQWPNAIRQQREAQNRAVPHHQPAAAIREPGGERRADEPAGHQGDPGLRRKGNSAIGEWDGFAGSAQ